MKKILTLTFCALCAVNANAIKLSDSFYFSPDFTKNNISVLGKVSNLFSLGLEVDYVDHDAHEDAVFTVAAPMIHTSETVQVVFKPFYTPKSNDLYAYGAMLHFLLAMENNTVDDKYTQANLSIAYANQRADVWSGTEAERKDYGEVAYNISLRKNFFNAFFFSMQGSAYQYLNGISNVRAINTILDQGQLANLNTYDVIYNLPKFSVGAAFNRMFESGANLYLLYGYIEYYTAGPEHSIILGNDFPLGKVFKGDIGYNHIIPNDGGKRDILKLTLSASF